MVALAFDFKNFTASIAEHIGNGRVVPNFIDMNIAATRTERIA